MVVDATLTTIITCLLSNTLEISLPLLDLFSAGTINSLLQSTFAGVNAIIEFSETCPTHVGTAPMRGPTRVSESNLGGWTRESRDALPLGEITINIISFFLNN